mmetsp:Transcript_20051/g.40893  ORF Transcript_20051/g.40893 Transcript_20051/m.40893 type:complete len:229 (+) Transcript_20051:224-910(+)
MLHAPIHDDCAFAASAHCVARRLELGDHATRDDALLLEPSDVVQAEPGQQLPIWSIEHASYVGEEQQRASAERRGNRARHCVCVDIVRHSIASDGDRRDDRDDAAVHQALQQLGAHGTRLAHLPQAHLGPVLFHVELALRCHHLVVLSREPHSAAARERDRARDLLVDAATQHHLCRVHCGAVRHAQPRHELAPDLKLLQHGINLRPAAMDHHHPDSERLHQRAVSRE